MKNREFVAYDPGLETAWIFAVAPTKWTTTGRFQETLQRIEDIFDAFGGLLYPRELEYIIFAVEKGVSVDSVDLSSLSPRTHDIDRSFTISFEDLVDVLQENTSSDETIPWLTRLSSNRAAVRLRLNREDHFIDIGSDRYRTWTDNQVSEKPPSQSPLKVRLTHYGTGNEEQQYFQIVIYTYTDIWFENTEIGRINRERLTDALSRFASALGEDTTVSSEFVPSPYDDEILDAIRS